MKIWSRSIKQRIWKSWHCRGWIIRRRESYADRLAEIGDLEMAFSHETFAVLDKAGRVQLHKEDLEKIGVKGNKVRIEVEENRIVIRAPG